MAADRRLAIVAGTVVTGDGKTLLAGGAVVISGGRVEAIEPHWPSGSAPEIETLDATGCLVLPGLVNCHTHGVSPGPLFPSAGPALPEEQWRANLDRHLLAGTTTVLSLDGFVTMEEIREADRSHPVNVKGATAHTPASLEAARACDGVGLTAESSRRTVEDMLGAGAVAIGEMGAGTTLGGGGQDTLHLPRAVRSATGVRIDPHQARAIKEAALGRRIEPKAFDVEAMRAALEAAGLASLLTPWEARVLVDRCVLPSVAASRSSFRESACLSAEHDVPALLHCAAASADAMRDLIRRPVPGARLIACHCNHSSFTPEEARTLASELAAHGVGIEVSIVDMLAGDGLIRSRGTWDALLEVPGLVDVLATDWGSDGVHDPLICAVQDVVEQGHASLPAAVAMATSRAATLVPGLAPERGLLAPGRIADVVVASDGDLADVRHVFVGGRQVVRDGNLTELVTA